MLSAKSSVRKYNYLAVGCSKKIHVALLISHIEISFGPFVESSLVSYTFSVLSTAFSGTTITESHSLSVGLAVGISVFLFIVCVVIGIIILRWAIRKGYLRHVARSYKSFRNPDTPVSFDNTQHDSQQCNVNVHI